MITYVQVENFAINLNHLNCHWKRTFIYQNKAAKDFRSLSLTIIIYSY